MATRKTPDQDASDIRVINNKLDYIQRDVIEIKTSIAFNYVTKEQFEPIQKIVYGLVGLILVAVVGALMTLIIRKP